MIDISTISCNKTIKNLEYYKEKYKTKSFKEGNNTEKKKNK